MASNTSSYWLFFAFTVRHSSVGSDWNTGQYAKRCFTRTVGHALLNLHINLPCFLDLVMEVDESGHVVCQDDRNEEYGVTTSIEVHQLLQKFRYLYRTKYERNPREIPGASETWAFLYYLWQTPAMQWYCKFMSMEFLAFINIQCCSTKSFVKCISRKVGRNLSFHGYCNLRMHFFIFI